MMPGRRLWALCSRAMAHLTDIIDRARSGAISHEQMLDELVSFPYKQPSWAPSPQPTFIGDYSYDEGRDYCEPDTWNALSWRTHSPPFRPDDLVAVARRIAEAHKSG